MSEIEKSSQAFTKNLARVATGIRDNIKKQISVEEENGPLVKCFREFKLVLNDLTLEAFSDMYAQTISYWLLFIRIFHSVKINLEGIKGIFLSTSPFLESLLGEISQYNNNLTSSMYLENLGIIKLVTLLNNTDIQSILSNFHEKWETKDPLTHFYEDFLRYYQPNQRIERGVFYSPNAVVSFIVRSVNHLLQSQFDCKDGLADDSFITLNGEKIPKIQILDPATGTGTFLSHIIDLIYESFKKKYRSLDKVKFQQKWKNYVNNNLLSRLFGFELLITPYTIAHLKLGLKLRETGYTFQQKKRLGVYLANTLEGTHQIEDTITKFINTGFLSKECETVNKIKMDHPISIIVGNPPYAGHSANKSKWIDTLLHGKNNDNSRKVNYFEVDGEALQEKNPKWLNDDYVKFIRFAQWRVEKTGYGIVAFITNHSFLDNPTFRGMRQQLMKTFTDIYILDLHGNTRRKEISPDGQKDQNVFDIQQGVCIFFFVKNPSRKGEARIFRADLWGLRKYKYEFLENYDLATIDWREITSFSPWYMFYDLNMTRWNEYQSWWKITDIFSLYSVGIMTGQDSLTIQETPQKIRDIIEDFVLLSETDLRIKHKVKKDKRQWTFQKAKRDLLSCGLRKSMSKSELREKFQNHIVPILYRPFDKRYTFYTGYSRGFHERPRGRVMKHMILGKNLGLVVSRNSRPAPWRDIYITESIIELGVMATRAGNNAPIFPLYLFEQKDGRVRNTINFTEDFKCLIKRTFEIELNLDAEKILYYIIAILHSREYRKRYEDFLKIDFPRIPFSENTKLFNEMIDLGRELSELYLMKSRRINEPLVTLKGSTNDNSVIIRTLMHLDDNKLKINKKEYFDGISKRVYDFYIGGYRVCHKWLRDRRGKELTLNEIHFFGKIVRVIQEIMRIMEKIDIIMEKYGGWPKAFNSSL